MNTIVCDRCGKTETGRESFASIKHKRTLEIKFRKNVYCAGCYERVSDFDLCDSCARELVSWFGMEAI